MGQYSFAYNDPCSIRQRVKTTDGNVRRAYRCIGTNRVSQTIALSSDVASIPGVENLQSFGTYSQQIYSGAAVTPAISSDALPDGLATIYLAVEQVYLNASEDGAVDDTLVLPGVTAQMSSSGISLATGGAGYVDPHHAAKLLNAGCNIVAVQDTSEDDSYVTVDILVNIVIEHT